MWKQTDIFDRRIMKKWTKRDEEEKTWEHLREFFEGKMQEIEEHVAGGGVTKEYAAANAVEDIQLTMDERECALRLEHANAITEMEKRISDKIDKLTEAMLTITKEREQEREKRSKRSKRRRRIEQHNSDSEDIDCSSKEERPLPRRHPRDNKAKGKPKKKATAATEKKVSMSQADGTHVELTPKRTRTRTTWPRFGAHGTHSCRMTQRMPSLSGLMAVTATLPRLSKERHRHGQRRTR